MRLFASLLILITSVATAQSPVIYSLDFSNIEHHELKVTVEMKNIQGDKITMKMPNSSPGRYALHNFAKNVYEEAAFDLNGNPLKIQKTTPYVWEIAVTDGTAKFQYTVYGNHADGTYMGVDSRKVHMNMPATFPYPGELYQSPVKLLIPKYENWDVATQLQKESENTFSAPDFYYFYDSPTIVGAIDWRRWTVDGQTIEIAMMHEGTKQQLDAYTDWVKKVVEEEKKMFGSLPKFDFGRYTFLAMYNPWVDGDGMEHRNSTICSSTGNLENNSSQLINTIAHEFFHSWNIERIRPKTLEPFNFDEANLSNELWFGEGFTNYLDGIALTRAKIQTPEQFIKSFTGTLNYVQNNPGRAFRGPIEMSAHATFVDAGTANDETNYHNTFVSYYSYGEVLGLALDLTLRLDHNTSLDAYMKLVWNKYGQPEIPYTISNLEDLLAELTKNKAFAGEFFKKYIYGSELPDFKRLFEGFGIKLSILNPGSAYFNSPKIEDRILQTPVVRGTALYEAGLEQGDIILTINGQEIENTSDLNRAINKMQVGETYEISYEQMGKLKTRKFTTVQDPRVTLSYLSDGELKKPVIKKRNEWFLGE